MSPKILLVVLVVFLSGCGKNPVPKPFGHFRIDLPDHEYQQFSKSCPFTFDYSKFATVISVKKGIYDCWFNVDYPKYKATVHLSYYAVSGDVLNTYLEDAYSLAMKHLQRADELDEIQIKNDSNRVFGMIYDFKGGTASNFQFYVTDSVNHFVRGALYFNVPPNPDSIAPVEGFIEKDLFRLTESFRWVNG
ncbi:MAG TPA: gliding motility lipoprotein GldD [Flavobacteriales bacterium]|jgi:gliding motility-associated lipoprotein GldD|nr:gliding motility lipoprotein GldD [Flavobacteriales bacterium]